MCSEQLKLNILMPGSKDCRKDDFLAPIASLVETEEKRILDNIFRSPTLPGIFQIKPALSLK